ncbi:MAG: serine/threonine protein kinase [Sandaracinus sp.]|nr:serine/threonine protein kinase [Sandaracinus sp.]
MRASALEIGERLGAGGMAETFVAVRRGPGGFEQRVCLKRILPHLAEDPEIRRLFEQEAHLSAQLSHANVVQLLDYASEGDRPHLVFELIEGTDLRQLHHALRDEGQPLTTGLVAHVALEVASALAYAHSQGVVHRDVSPSNVLLSLAGEVKLTDFGIAKAFFGTPRLTRSGAVKGKVPYIAPEYAQTGKADTRADQFSLGVMIYELLVGERPFRGKSDVEILERIISGSHDPLLERAPHVPPELATIVERMLSVEPDARFPDTEVMLDALRQIAPPPTARSILQSLVRGHRRPDPATLPFEPTGRAGGDTVRLAAPKAPPTSTPVPAGPNEETRTAVATRDPATSTVPDAPIPTETRTVFEPVVPTPPPTAAPPRWPLLAIGLGSVVALGAVVWWLLR